MPPAPRDHGGDLHRARARWGGRTEDWLDLSTGINPRPWPLPPLPPELWTRLPDAELTARAEAAARAFWDVPRAAAVLAVPGASAAIARIPELAPPGRVAIPGPTYNEHAAAFRLHGWQPVAEGPAEARVAVHPNNPDGRLWTARELPAGRLTVIDESFCDTLPGHSLVALAARPDVIVLKSFGKFWGLAGLRLGFVIARPERIAALAELLGPWPASGPALAIAAAALDDRPWAAATRARLAAEAARLDACMARIGARLVGGTPLFRLFRVDDAAALQARLAARRIWTRVFPDRPELIRLGLPGSERGWARLEEALG